MQVAGITFREVWLVAFAFATKPGLHPAPIYLAAHELKSQRMVQVPQVDLRSMRCPPYATDREALCVAFNATSVLSCHLALGWPVPLRVLDLQTEIRCLTNGLRLEHGTGLFGALAWFGLAGADVASDQLQWPSPESEFQGRVTMYKRVQRCNAHVSALSRLLQAIDPMLDLPRALLRGRYTAALARIEANGVPVDAETWRQLATSWPVIRRELIHHIDAEFGVFENGILNIDRFEAWLVGQRVAWPRLPSGRLDLSDQVFRDMSRAFPLLQPLRQLFVTLSDVRLDRLAVGHDGRIRTDINPFASRTGRNQPSSSGFILGSVTWLRRLIKPAQGLGLAYVDWAQQEFGIAAAMSGDDAMWEAYESGDPYLAFAVNAKAAPPWATRSTHPQVRERFKACTLAAQYGMGSDALGRLGQLTRSEAAQLIAFHRRTYPRYWYWQQQSVDQAVLQGRMQTVFGWRVAIDSETKPGFIGNFPMQANAAEMLRLACCLVTEAGIKVCAPIHDALLIEAPLGDLDHAAEHTQAAMAEASRIVLNGRELRTDVSVVRHPDRFHDPRGAVIWSAVSSILRRLQSSDTSGSAADRPAHERITSCSSARARPISLYVSNRKDASNASD